MLCRTGVIPAPEFAERFFSVFAATPGNIRHELFMQLALLVPQPAKRLELLQQAQNVSGRHVSCPSGCASRLDRVGVRISTVFA